METNEHDLNDRQKRIYNHIEKKQPIDRQKLSDDLKIPRSTIYDNIEKLIEQNLISKYRKQINTRGSSNVFYKTNGII